MLLPEDVVRHSTELWSMYVSKNSCADKSDDEENEVGNARRARDHDNAGRAEGDAATAGDARARLTPCPAGH